MDHDASQVLPQSPEEGAREASAQVGPPGLSRREHDMLLFAAATSRIPLSTVGLLQYLTPSMQLAIGVFVYDEPMPPLRLVGFGVVWLALAVFTVDTLRAARASRRRDVVAVPAGL